MSSAARPRNVYRCRRVAVALMGVLGILLEGCSGTTGSSGSPGAAGPPGPAGPIAGAATLNVSSAAAITGKITAVAINGPPVVKFQLNDQNGAPLKGMLASELGFIIAKLIPGQNGSASQWVSYIYGSNAPGACPASVTACATAAQTEAAVESATSGTLLDNGDGNYQYTFKKDITKDPKVTYDATLTHRVGFEIRGLAQANNGAYTFQPSTGATSGIFSREIIDTATCDSCHTQLSAHGGARVDVQYCVMCHNPGSTEPSSANTLDFKVMIHKIHDGNNLPSIQTASGPNTTPILGLGYWIVGYGQSLANFNTVVFPQDTRNCVTCHAQNVPTLPQAANYQTMPTAEACGSCHDNVNFATGANHGSGIVTDDTQCTTCHGSASTIDNGKLQVIAAHVIPERVFQKQFTYNILQTSNTAPGQTPLIRFSVTDPTNNNKPWNVLSDEPFTNCAGTAPSDSIMMIAWNTADYTNTGIGANGGEIDIPLACAASPPTANGDGTFSIVSPQPIPTDVTGTAGIYFNGHPSHNFNDDRGVQAIPVPNSTAYSSITDATLVPRRLVVDLKKCDVCHDQLNPLAHASDRVESVTGCPFCHEPNATDQAARALLGVVTAANAVAMAPDQLQEQSIDFKVMIHAIHDGPTRDLVDNSPYVIYHNGAVHNFTTITPFPGVINNCLACHESGTFYPPDPSNPTPLASTIRTVDSTGAPLPNQIAVTAGAAVCSSCHASTLERTHMIQNGANFAAVKGTNNQVVSSETCVVCHGAGAIADVQVVHHLAAYH